MKAKKGDLWEHWQRGEKVVVTTNIGWTATAPYWNNMGAGMAAQAARRFPELPEWYGRFCRATFPLTPVIEHPRYRLIFLPVKPLLNRNNPEISWDQEASLDLIEAGLRQLREHHGEIALGLPGCGNGGLKMAQVFPLLERYLAEERFTVVDQSWGIPKANPFRLFANSRNCERDPVEL
jgi:hypothetical protein